MDSNLDVATIRLVLLDLFIAIISFTIHEWGHAKMADRLGDDTPRLQGRVTLNPLAHIDLLGTIIIPILSAMGFFGHLGVIGWAKPVMTNPNNFRNRTVDQAWVTIAGPAMNAVLATVATVAAAIAARYLPSLVGLLEQVIGLNVLLIVFNLIPIPPLDGSKFLMYWFGMSEETYIRFAQWGGFLLLLLVNLNPFQLLLIRMTAVVMHPLNLLFRALT